MKKGLLSLFIALILIVTAATSALAATAKISKAEYEGSGYIEVDFKRNVQYKGTKVTVMDQTQESYAATIYEKDSDSLTFFVKNIKAGMMYTFTLSGVRSGGAGSYGNVSGIFKTPAADSTVSIKKVDFDDHDQEIEIDFSTKVKYSKPAVCVKDADGKTYKTRILDKDNDSMEVRVTGLQIGKSYTVSVSGVKAKNDATYKTVSYAFTAWDD